MYYGTKPPSISNVYLSSHVDHFSASYGDRGWGWGHWGVELRGDLWVWVSVLCQVRRSKCRGAGGGAESESEWAQEKVGRRARGGGRRREKGLRRWRRANKQTNKPNPAIAIRVGLPRSCKVHRYPAVDVVSHKLRRGNQDSEAHQ